MSLPKDPKELFHCIFCGKGKREGLRLIGGQGIYVCEDIMWNCVDEWCSRLEAIYSKQYPTYEFAFVVLPDRGNQANNLLVVRRGAD